MSDTLQAARTEARQKLEQIAVRFEALRIEQEKLKELVAALDGYLTVSSEAENTAVTGPNGSEGSVEQKPSAWVAAQNVLLAKGCPMTVPEIEKASIERGVFVTRDAIRRALGRKPELFIPRANGSYELNRGNLGMS